MKSELRNALKKIGFNEYITNILHSLYTHNKPITAKDLSRLSNVPLERIYSILIDLEKQKLITSIPGKIKLFQAVSKTKLKNILEHQKDQQIKQEKQEFNDALDIINKTISNPTNDIQIQYFQNSDQYWKEYETVRDTLKRNDQMLIINSIRICQGFLPEELENNKVFKKFVKNIEQKEDKKGIKEHYILDMKSLVERTKSELQDDRKVKQSILQTIEHFKKYQDNYHFSFISGIKNIIIVIMQDVVFLEFYTTTSLEISSALKIRNESVKNDFKKWFLAIAKKKFTFEEFERRALKEIKKISL